jgi:hypothetical protein
MLKRYATTERIRWTGKAWEIRHALRQELKRRGGHTRIAELLSDRSTVIAR